LAAAEKYSSRSAFFGSIAQNAKNAAGNKGLKVRFGRIAQNYVHRSGFSEPVRVLYAFFMALAA
jgi:hypothetical protein